MDMEIENTSKSLKEHPESTKEKYLEQLKVRQIAIELEIKSRLRILQDEGKVDKVDLGNSKALYQALEEFIKVHSDMANTRRLKGLFSYDIQYNPNYTRALKMKEKIGELKKRVAE